VADKTDAQRIADIKALLAKTKPKDELSLQDCAAVWGVSRPRFINKRAEMADFPQERRDGNAHYYPAKAALKAMLNRLEEQNRRSTERATRLGKLVPKNLSSSISNLSVQDLARLNRLHMDVEVRERDQGDWIAKAEVSMVVGEVFSDIAEFMSGLANKIDPHGRLSPKIRADIDSNGREALLKLHRKIKGLVDDVDAGSAGTENRRSRRPQVRGQGKGGNRLPA
jgi:hypothetical protein